jgi:hypothetical protein
MGVIDLLPVPRPTSLFPTSTYAPNYSPYEPSPAPSHTSVYTKKSSHAPVPDQEHVHEQGRSLFVPSAEEQPEVRTGHGADMLHKLASSSEEEFLNYIEHFQSELQKLHLEDSSAPIAK